jgi:tetratricopeptide (TPR) repeat protein
VLVFFFALRLQVNRAGSEASGLFIAGITGLIFAVHPFHVEAVAWVISRKDVLYALFFLLSLLSYLKYLEKKKFAFLCAAFALFYLSCMSKLMAISLPLTLVAVDYYRGRKMLSRGALLEKVPFFLLSIFMGGGWGYLSGMAGIAAPDSDGLRELAERGAATDAFPLFERLVFAVAGYVQYLWKMIIPRGLSIVYPYPVEIGEGVPAHYFLYGIPFLAIAGLFVWSLKRSRETAFAIMFFSFNIMLTLHLVIPVTDAVICDRYSYVASIGVFFLGGHLLHRLLTRFPHYRRQIYALIAAGTIVLGVSTWQRAMVWKDSISVWSDVIDKYPDLAKAWNNRGAERHRLQDYRGAMEDFDEALRLKDDYFNAYNNRGLSKKKLADLPGAEKDFTRALAIRPEYDKGLFNRGDTRYKMGLHEEALDDLTRAIELNPLHYKAYYQRGSTLLKLKRHEDAYRDFAKVVEIEPRFYQAYVNLGLIRQWEKEYEEALEHFNTAARHDPGGSLSLLYRARLYEVMGNREGALADYNRALEKDPGNEDLRLSRDRLSRRGKE